MRGVSDIDPWLRFRSAVRRRLEVDRWLGVAGYARPRRRAPAPTPAAPPSAVPLPPVAVAPPPPPAPPVDAPAPPVDDFQPVEVAGAGLPVPATEAERQTALERIATLAAGCPGCPLGKTRHRVVFGVGTVRARLMIVGEAPGYHEDQQGEPFVGPAGQLLDRQLTAIHLTRDDVYITNTLKCRPPHNRDPWGSEKQTCAPWLHRQIELIQPEMLLAVGAHAARVLLGMDDGVPMYRLRGRMHEYRGISLVATYHPAYLLRLPRSDEGWRKTWDDLKRVRDALGLKRPGDPD